MHITPTIPGYKIGERIDSGGAAEVWHAHGPDGKACALKVVSTSDAQVAARFLRERELLQAITHPRVVKALAVGSTSDWHWLAMELVPGGNLRARLALGVPPEEMALLWMIDALDGLSALHAAGLQHRDLTPANLLLTDEEQPRVLVADFGLARRLDVDDRLTATAAVVGTPAYLAPERATEAQQTNVDGVRADIYAMGAVFFFLLTGRAPFIGATPYEVLAQAASAPRPDPADLRPSVSKQARAIVRCAMAMDPMQRYGDAATFVADVRAVLAGDVPSHAGRIRREADQSSQLNQLPTVITPPTPLRLKRWVVSGLSIVLLIIGLFIGQSLTGPSAVELRDLQDARQTATYAAWRLYLDRYPNGIGAEEATNILNLMSAQQPPSDALDKQQEEEEIAQLKEQIVTAQKQVEKARAAVKEKPVESINPESSTDVVTKPEKPEDKLILISNSYVPPANQTPTETPPKPVVIKPDLPPAVAPKITIDKRIRDVSSALFGTHDGCHVNPSNPNDQLVWTSSGAIRRSIDGGLTWTDAKVEGVKKNFNTTEWAHRTQANPNIVVISGLSTSIQQPDIALISKDGGSSWAYIPSPWKVSQIPDNDPNGLMTRSVTLSDGGVLIAVQEQENAPAIIWRSTNLGKTWSREAKTITRFHSILPVGSGILILYRDPNSYDVINVSPDLGRSHKFFGATSYASSANVILSSEPATWARFSKGVILLDDFSKEPFVIIGPDGKLLGRLTVDPLLRMSNGQLTIRSLAINPQKEQEWYASTYELGLICSYNNGITWKGFALKNKISTVTCAGDKNQVTLIATGKDKFVIDVTPNANLPDLFPLTLEETKKRLDEQGR